MYGSELLAEASPVRLMKGNGEVGIFARLAFSEIVNEASIISMYQKP